ncbi:hypothetical protein K2X05_01780 [bacterium]|nr:hypothetical protein [bacterium]
MIDLRKPYQWEDLNDSLKEQFKTTNQVRVYQSLSQALLETVMGFQSLYSHKRLFSHSLGLGTHADEALLFLSRQGIKGTEASKETTWDDKKNLFCVLDLDDALTAEIYESPASLDEKIFRISILHHQHLFEKKTSEPSENEVRIFSFEKGAIALHGKRCVSLPSVLAPTLHWASWKSEFSFSSNKTQAPAWVQKLESQTIANAQPLLSASTKRFYDRAILYWTDVEGEALRQTLIKDHQISQTSLESLSLSRWNELKLITQFEKRGWSPEMFRGALLLSTELASDNKLIEKIEQSVSVLRKRSCI